MRRVLDGPRQTGATAVLVAIVITVLFGFMALAMNVGHLLSVRGEMQNAVDSAAMAGALRLNGTLERLNEAEQLARGYALQHRTDSRDPVVLTATDNGPAVVFGSWNARDGFEEITARTPASARLITAVRANAVKPEPVWMRAFLGSGENADVGAMATAVTGGASKAPCDTAPLVIRMPCFYGEQALQCDSNYVMALSPARIDTGGLTNLIPLDYTEATANNSSASGRSICNALRDPPPEDCEFEANTTFLETTNGNEISAQCDVEETDKINEKICSWFKRWGPKGGETQVVPIPVVRFLQDNRPDDCNGQYGGRAEVMGFAMFEITGVYCKDESTPRTGPCSPFATEQCISAIYRCGLPPPVPGGKPGAGWFGTDAVPPQLAE